MNSRSACAFCSSPSFHRPLSQAVSLTSYSVDRHVGRRQQVIGWNASGTFVAKRPRSLLHRLAHHHANQKQQTVAAFNSNGNRPDDKFAKQSAAFMVSAARFFQSPSGQVVLWIGLVWLVLTGRIGFIFDSFLFLFAFITIVPVLAVLAFRWWLSRQLVKGTCPSCGSVVTGVKGQSFPCTVCGNAVQGEQSGSFSVKDPTSATIDIDAKQVDE